MKPGAGKAKGSSFEREFCKALSLWWSDGKDKDIFWRTHSSGARHGIKEECGDVMAVKAEGMPLTDKVMFELKHWNQSDLLLDLIRQDKKSELRDAWIKCQQEATRYNRIPLLVLKITNKTTICLCVRSECLPVKDKPPNPSFFWGGMSTYIMEWKQFLKCCKFNEWRKQQKTEGNLY